VALGPVVAGMLNDGLNARFGDIAIRYSLAIVYMGLVVALVISLIGTRFIRADYATAKSLAAT
jgi:hypothetical protein